MKTSVLVLAAMMSCAPGYSQQQAPIAAQPAAELHGPIQRVQIERGRGMPFLEVEEKGKTVKVHLGSMRYLMEQGFNPKAGQVVDVKGYRTSDGIVASTVKIEGENRILKLRDENGWPVWRGGPRRGGGAGGPGRGCCR
jgi:hypothetical protein